MTNTKTVEAVAINPLETGNSFVGRTFDRLECVDQKFAGKEFVQCEFNFCTFKYILFRETDFMGCRFNGCRFESCDFVDGRFKDTRFHQCYILWTEFFPGNRSEVDHGFDSVIFHGTFLKNSLIGGLLKDVDFSASTLKDNDFGWACPKGKIIPPFKIAPIVDMGKRILKMVDEDGEGSLDMSCWHGSCGTTHCLAGWSIILHPQGKILEEMFTSEIAGCILFPEGVKYFFSDQENALEFLKTFDS